jgi:hypothetical protein
MKFLHRTVSTIGHQIGEGDERGSPTGTIASEALVCGDPDIPSVILKETPHRIPRQTVVSEQVLKYLTIIPADLTRGLLTFNTEE